MSASEIHRGADVPHPPANPAWTVEQLLRHIDGTMSAVLVRNTQDWPFAIDRRVDRAGHGEHGGWYLSPGGLIACGGIVPCDEPLFPVRDVIGNLRDVRLAGLKEAA